MNVRGLLTITLIGSIASLAILWTDLIPLGIPGEWTWGRLNVTPAGLLWAAVVCTMWSLGWLTLAWAGDRRLAAERPSGLLPRLETAGWLLVLVAGAYGWLQAVQSVAIEGLGLGKSPYVLYYRRTEGYFWQARYEMVSVPLFLQQYEDLMAEQDYLHIGTHPPGLALLHAGLLSLYENSPTLVERIESLQPEGVTRTLQQIQQQSRGTQFEVTRTDAACLALGAMLTQLAAALTVVPLYLFLRLTFDRRSAWRAIVFWPLIPAIGVFLPKSDLLYPVVAITAAWLWRSGFLRATNRIGLASVLLWLAGGLVLWGGMTLSLAFLAVVALIGAQMLCDVASGVSRHGHRPGAISHLLTMLMCSGGCALLALGAWLHLFARFELNLLSTWSWNFSNHALFYDHNVRTWWQWWLVNPLELTLAAGVPVVLLAVWGSFADRCGWRGLLETPAVSFALVWGLLWLSGKNMGEGARLWIILLPWLVGGLASAFRQPSPLSVPQLSVPQLSVSQLSVSQPESTIAPERDAAVSSPSSHPLPWLLFLGLQSIVASLTILRVDGFHFMELLQGP